MISLLHATYGRPKKAVEAMRHSLLNAATPGNVEYIVAVEDTDLESMKAFDETEARVVSGQFGGSAPAWDAAAKVAKGELLVQMQDDLVLPMDWDRMLLERITPEYHTPFPPRPLVIRVSDGFRKDSLLCTAIINRARYEQVGEFLHAGYRSVYSDGEFTLRAILDAKAGKCTLIDARDITFLHRHHYHDPSVPMDATYARENSNEAYAQGLRLFNERNPGWRRSGVVDWM